MDTTGKCEHGVEIFPTDVNSAGEVNVVGLDAPFLDSQSDTCEEEPLMEDGEPIVDVEKLPTYYTAIRLVPLTMLFGLSFGVTGPVFTQLMIIRVCGVGLNYSSEVCSHLNEDIYKNQADAVRTETAKYQLYNTFISCIPSVLFSVLLGSWSDRYGRKLPMLLPFFGTFFAHAYMVLCAYIPLHPAFLLISPVISSISGGQVIVHMAMFSYVGDYTTKKSRAINIAFIDGAMFLCGSGGQALGGWLMTQYGIPVPYFVNCGLTALSFLYILFVIRDRHPKKHAADKFSIRSLFSLERVMENWHMLKKQRPGDTRKHLWLILGCMLLSSVVLIGDGSIMQLFLEFRPFKWTLEFYTLFGTISGVITNVIFMAAVVILRKVFKVSDTMLAVLATLSAIAQYFGYAIAVTDWMIYVATACGVFKLLVIVVIRSMLAGMVQRDEIGKVMSLISSLHSLTPLFGSTIFTNVFAYTSAWWSGFCFVLGAFLLVPVLATFAYVDVARRSLSYALLEEDV